MAIQSRERVTVLFAMSASPSKGQGTPPQKNRQDQRDALNRLPKYGISMGGCRERFYQATNGA